MRVYGTYFYQNLAEVRVCVRVCWGVRVFWTFTSTRIWLTYVRLCTCDKHVANLFFHEDVAEVHVRLRAHTHTHTHTHTSTRRR